MNKNFSAPYRPRQSDLFKRIYSLLEFLIRSSLFRQTATQKRTFVLVTDAPWPRTVNFWRDCTAEKCGPLKYFILKNFDKFPRNAEADSGSSRYPIITPSRYLTYVRSSQREAAHKDLPYRQNFYARPQWNENIFSRFPRSLSTKSQVFALAVVLTAGFACQSRLIRLLRPKKSNQSETGRKTIHELK